MKILITGSEGMIGSVVTKKLATQTVHTILAPSHQYIDLEDRMMTVGYFKHMAPDIVILLAAKVGGIGANMADPVGFLDKNLRIITNSLEACHKAGVVKRVILLGSSCIYPRHANQPIKESALMTGPLEPTNEPYAIAKIAGIRLARAYRDQYGMDVICPMLCNVYGGSEDRKGSVNNQHVIPAMIRKFLVAKANNDPAVVLWGDGSPHREFMHVDDAADALLLLTFLPDAYYFDNQNMVINVGTGHDTSIRELAHLIAYIVGYDGQIHWDTGQANGMPRKCLDVSRLNAMQFVPQVSLPDGIHRMVQQMVAQQSGHCTCTPPTPETMGLWIRKPDCPIHGKISDFR